MRAGRWWHWSSHLPQPTRRERKDSCGAEVLSYRFVTVLRDRQNATHILNTRMLCLLRLLSRSHLQWVLGAPQALALVLHLAPTGHRAGDDAPGHAVLTARRGARWLWMLGVFVITAHETAMMIVWPAERTLQISAVISVPPAAGTKWKRENGTSMRRLEVEMKCIYSKATEC